jgi:hypothetical protein
MASYRRRAENPRQKVEGEVAPYTKISRDPYSHEGTEVCSKSPELTLRDARPETWLMWLTRGSQKRRVFEDVLLII